MRIGSLFTGAGGLDLAVEAAFSASTAWRSDIKPAANALIEHRWPGTNLGDITRIDWTAVEPVDILAGGFPCTDLSWNGKQAGLIRYGDPTRTGLWGHMAQAIDTLRPRWVVAENVRGLLNGKADRPPVGPGAEPVDGELRALGAVLGDLADLGYDAQWCGLRASDVGAPHQRFRIFVLAHATNTGGQAREVGDRLAQSDAAELWRARSDHRGGDLGWGPFAGAVDRWAETLGRPAPAHYVDGGRGQPVLSADLTEWMMGWPEGWTRVPGLNNAARLSLCGDGVVPHQAFAALSYLRDVAELI